jgi:hypothetical protein
MHFAVNIEAAGEAQARADVHELAAEAVRRCVVRGSHRPTQPGSVVRRPLQR